METCVNIIESPLPNKANIIATQSPPNCRTLYSYSLNPMSSHHLKWTSLNHWPNLAKSYNEPAKSFVYTVTEFFLRHSRRNYTSSNREGISLVHDVMLNSIIVVWAKLVIGYKLPNQIYAIFLLATKFDRGH